MGIHDHLMGIHDTDADPGELEAADTADPVGDVHRSVGQAISYVMGKLPAIGKTEQAKGVPYKFRGIEAMTVALQPLMAEAGLVIVPQAQSVCIDPSPGAKDDKWQDVLCKFDWLIMGPDGSSITASTYGIGRDHTDKGTNKAQTQAYKYLIMHLFCVSDPKDDGDAHDYSDQVAPVKDPKVAETYRKLVELAGADQDAATTLKEWAHSMEQTLSEKALAESEAWRLAVEAKMQVIMQAKAARSGAEGDAIQEAFPGSEVVPAEDVEVVRDESADEDESNIPQDWDGGY